MTKYFCNPLNVDYRYQFNQQVMPGMGEGAMRYPEKQQIHP